MLFLTHPLSKPIDLPASVAENDRLSDGQGVITVMK